MSPSSSLTDAVAVTMGDADGGAVGQELQGGFLEACRATLRVDFSAINSALPVRLEDFRSLQGAFVTRLSASTVSWVFLGLSTAPR